MKKTYFSLAIISVFLVTLAAAIYIPSKDNIYNAGNDLENKSFVLDEKKLVNWGVQENSFISTDDSQIVLADLDCYVNTLKLDGKIDFSNSESDIGENAQIYYTQEPGEGFSEEKSFFAVPQMAGGCTYYKIDMDVYSLRLDVTRFPGAELKADNAEINSGSIIFSFVSLAKYCIFPTLISGIALFAVTKRRQIVPYLLKLKKYLPLLQNLISRDLKVKYRRSFLGFLWSILNPLLMALVLNTVFSRLFRFQIEHFAVYYLVGSLIFNFVIECTTGSMTSILAAAPLIKKVYIPKYIFPLEKCCFAFVNMLFGIVAVIVVMIIQGVKFTPTALLFFIPMIYAFVFAYGLSLVLAALTVFFRDMEHLYSVWTTIWMYLTPIIYPETLLVQNGLETIMRLNPMYYYVHSLRSIVMYDTLPSLNENIICVMFSFLMLISGLLSFKKVQDKFILYI